MKKVRLIASKINVEIEADMIVLYTIEDDDSDSKGVVIPLSYCSIVDIDDGMYPDDGITFTLGLKRAGRRAYFEEQIAANRHIRFSSDRYIKFPYCVHKTIDDIMSSYFIDNDLAKTMMKFLDIIENLNYEYLRSHGEDTTAIKEVSTTINAVEKAKRIVNKKLKPKNQGTEKVDER